MEAAEATLEYQLQLIKNAEIRFYLDGRPASPRQILTHCVREENSYMADYVMADTGKIREIRFDKVKAE